MTKPARFLRNESSADQFRESTVPASSINPAASPEELAPTPPQAPLAPTPPDAVRCRNCGSVTGQFVSDPYTGGVIHSGCSELVTRNWAGRPRDIALSDVRTGLQPPEG